jgi:hypothetical protein
LLARTNFDFIWFAGRLVPEDLYTMNPNELPEGFAKAIYGTTLNLKTAAVLALCIARVAHGLHHDELWEKMTEEGDTADLVRPSEYEEDPGFLNRKTAERVCKALEIRRENLFDGVMAHVIRDVKFGHLLVRGEMPLNDAPKLPIWAMQIAHASGTYCDLLMEVLDVEIAAPAA